MSTPLQPNKVSNHRTRFMGCQRKDPARGAYYKMKKVTQFGIFGTTISWVKMNSLQPKNSLHNGKNPFEICINSHTERLLI